MNIKIDKEMAKAIGKGAMRLGKTIVWEGTKAVTVKAATKAITTGFEGGMDDIKKLRLDDVIGKAEVKEKKPKKKWFSKNKKEVVEEILEEVTEDVVETAAEAIEEIADADVEIIDKK